MACTVDLSLNDIPGDFALDLTSIVISNVQAGLNVTNNFDGTVTVSSTVVGTYTFDYTIDDVNGNTSNVATVTITINPAPVPSPPTPSGIIAADNNSSPGAIPFPAGITPGCDLFMVTGQSGGGSYSVSPEWTGPLDNLTQGTINSRLYHRVVDGTETTWSFLTGSLIDWCIVEFCDVDSFTLDTNFFVAEPFQYVQPLAAPNDRPYTLLAAQGTDGDGTRENHQYASDWRKLVEVARDPPGAGFAYRMLDQGETITSSLRNGVDDLVPDGRVDTILHRLIVLQGALTGSDPDLDVTVQTSTPTFVGAAVHNGTGTTTTTVLNIPGYVGGDFVVGALGSNTTANIQGYYEGYARGPHPDSFSTYDSYYGFPVDPTDVLPDLRTAFHSGVIRGYRGVNVKRPIADMSLLLQTGSATVNFAPVEVIAGDIIVCIAACDNTNGSIGGTTFPVGAINDQAVNQWPGRTYSFDFIAPITGTFTVPSFTGNASFSRCDAYCFVLKGA